LAKLVSPGYNIKTLGVVSKLLREKKLYLNPDNLKVNNVVPIKKILEKGEGELQKVRAILRQSADNQIEGSDEEKHQTEMLEVMEDILDDYTVDEVKEEREIKEEAEGPETEEVVPPVSPLDFDTVGPIEGETPAPLDFDTVGPIDEGEDTSVGQVESVQTYLDKLLAELYENIGDLENTNPVLSEQYEDKAFKIEREIRDATRNVRSAPAETTHYLNKLQKEVLKMIDSVKFDIKNKRTKLEVEEVEEKQREEKSRDTVVDDAVDNLDELVDGIRKISKERKMPTETYRLIYRLFRELSSDISNLKRIDPELGQTFTTEMNDIIEKIHNIMNKEGKDKGLTKKDRISVEKMAAIGR
jgi:hypothetical protein